MIKIIREGHEFLDLLREKSVNSGFVKISSLAPEVI